MELDEIKKIAEDSDRWIEDVLAENRMKKLSFLLKRAKKATLGILLSKGIHVEYEGEDKFVYKGDKKLKPSFNEWKKIKGR